MSDEPSKIIKVTGWVHADSEGTFGTGGKRLDNGQVSELVHDVRPESEEDRSPGRDASPGGDLDPVALAVAAGLLAAGAATAYAVEHRTEIKDAVTTRVVDPLRGRLRRRSSAIAESADDYATALLVPEPDAPATPVPGIPRSVATRLAAEARAAAQVVAKNYATLRGAHIIDDVIEAQVAQHTELETVRKDEPAPRDLSATTPELQTPDTTSTSTTP